MENHVKRSPASARNRLRILALAWSTAFSLMPSSAATFTAGTPSRAKCRNASQVVGWNSLDDRKQPLEDVMVVVPVPLAGQLAVRGLQSVEESDGRVESDGWPAPLRRQWVRAWLTVTCRSQARNEPSRRRSNRGSSRTTTTSDLGRLAAA